MVIIPGTLPISVSVVVMIRKYLLQVLITTVVVGTAIYLNNWRNEEARYRSGTPPKIWKSVAPSGARFVVSMPDPVNAVNLSEPTPVGNLPGHAICSTDGWNSFMVMYADYPPEFVKATGSAVIFAKYQKGVSARYPGYECSQTPTTVSGYQGVEFSLKNDATGGIIRVVATLVGSRVYFALARTEHAHLPPRLFEQFFDSFRILPANSQVGADLCPRE